MDHYAFFKQGQLAHVCAGYAATNQPAQHAAGVTLGVCGCVCRCTGGTVFVCRVWCLSTFFAGVNALCMLVQSYCLGKSKYFCPSELVPHKYVTAISCHRGVHVLVVNSGELLAHQPVFNLCAFYAFQCESACLTTLSSPDGVGTGVIE